VRWRVSALQENECKQQPHPYPQHYHLKSLNHDLSHPRLVYLSERHEDFAFLILHDAEHAEPPGANDTDTLQLDYAVSVLPGPLLVVLPGDDRSFATMESFGTMGF
jgi:hypothetical protein